MTELDLVDAMLARDAGMQRALDHACREHPDWSDLAYAFLVRFCRSHAIFISEDVSDASIEWGMVQPPTLRSWGNVYRQAQRDGVISMCGVGKSRRRHASICPQWLSNVYKWPA